MAGEGYPIKYYPTFNSPQDLGYDVVEMGFDVVNIATNHMLDIGANGLLKTIDFWKNMDCFMIGGYENEEDFNTVRIYEKDGIKIAFLSFTYATNGILKPASSKLVIPYIDDEDMVSQIESAKQQADLIFVSMHWGSEGAFKPSDEQKRVAQLIADSGADAIIGHHPHVIQPVDWLTGKDGNKTLCVYSLGNFVAEQAYDYNMVGGIIEFDIVSENGETYIENPVFTP
ncbi:MAG: CapA family protein, partial [Clostridia bacterium]|nr:CapA family protein [Clostridia bacterium]